MNGEEFGEAECELRRVGGDIKSTVDFLELRLRDRFKETIVINVKVVDGLEGESVESR